MNIEEAIEILKNSKKLYLKEKIDSDILEEAIEALLTAYEKEKEENVKLRLQYIPLIEGELKAYKDRVKELKQELEKEKEKNNKIEKELEKHIKFCEQEAEGSLNNKICHISLKFNKRLLNILKEEE